MLKNVNIECSSNNIFCSRVFLTVNMCTKSIAISFSGKDFYLYRHYKLCLRQRTHDYVYMYLYILVFYGRKLYWTQMMTTNNMNKKKNKIIMRNNNCLHSSNHFNFKSMYLHASIKKIYNPLFAVLSRSRYLTQDINTRHLKPNRPTYTFLISLPLLLRVKAFNNKKCLHPLEVRGSGGGHSI
jgi:hypothetical protein